jgi:hypothetical protein
MAEIIGRQIEFGVATEATRGTVETVADKWMRKVTANVVEKASHSLDETTRGRLENGEGRRKVQSYVEGEVEGILHADVLGWLLSNIYGTVVSSVVTGSVYSHFFSLRQNIQHQSLTLFAKDGAVQQSVFSNAMINTLEITAGIDDYVRFKSGFIASVSTSNADTPSYDTEYDFVARDITIKMADTEGGLAGATAIKAKDLNFKFDQGLIRDHVVGAYTPDDIYNAHLMIDGSFTTNFADETFKDMYLGNTAKYMSITIQGEADLGSGNNPTITLVMNKVQIMDWNRTGGADELVTEEVQFRSFYNETDLEQSTVTLKNLTSAYVNVPSA